ncbi:MAG: SdpI family protein [Clostridiales bacterium]|uniref:SdpI family protein n=1 Tax=Eubacteriales TaxID=186802 RepID=UPI00059F3C54|nr:MULTISPECIES: SdpI family protein [Eubacteriales]NLZ34881.1 SdpI family protein [Clostridiales bacterium]TJX58816.1 SdpI family protein [Soehngenia saccharolytica]
MDKNKNRGILFIILANIVFAVSYYIANKNSSTSNLYATLIIAVSILIQYVIFRTYAGKAKDMAAIEKYYYKVLISSTIVLMTIQFVLLYSYFNAKIDSYKIVSIIISYMLIYIGNIMPQIKQNFIIGVRTKKALSNEKVWRKANTIGGISLVIVGTILFIICLFMRGKYLIVLLLVGVVLWSIINDFYISVYCKKNKI